MTDHSSQQDGESVLNRDVQQQEIIVSRNHEPSIDQLWQEASQHKKFLGFSLTVAIFAAIMCLMVQIKI